MLDFHSLGLLGLFLACLLAATILPFSSEIVLTAFVISGSYSNLSLVLTASLGNSVGGAINYLLGFYGRQLFYKTKEFKYKKWIDKYGAWCASIAWVPIIGDPLMIALGFFRTNVIATILIMTTFKFLRYVVLIYFLIQLK
jgi:membrane protein YqaA with SNARE-associated domain